MTTDGSWTEYDLGLGGSDTLNDVTTGPDGKLWLTVADPTENKIGRLNPSTSAVNLFKANLTGAPNQITAASDGKLYPQGLVGEAIPLASRITAICDVFDALRSQRVYKDRWTLDDAVAELKAQRGRHSTPRSSTPSLPSCPASSRTSCSRSQPAPGAMTKATRASASSRSVSRRPQAPPSESTRARPSRPRGRRHRACRAARSPRRSSSRRRP